MGRVGEYSAAYSIAPRWPKVHEEGVHEEGVYEEGVYEEGVPCPRLRGQATDCSQQLPGCNVSRYVLFTACHLLFLTHAHASEEHGTGGRELLGFFHDCR